MKSQLATLLLVLVGCSAQPHDEIEIAAVTNYPDPDVSSIVGMDGIERKPEPERSLVIRCNHARVQDVVRRIAEHEGLKLEFKADVGNAFCTVNLTYEQALPVIERIVDAHDCVVTQRNSVIVVKNKKRHPEPNTAD